jgi:hypothetical protein
MWIPEVSLGNATFQEPVQDVEKVPKTRWKLVRTSKFEDPTLAANTPTVMLYLQAKDGCLYTMRAQVVLRGFPRYLCS